NRIRVRPGCRQRRREIDRDNRDVSVGPGLAADQDVVQVRVGLELVGRRDYVTEAQAAVPGKVPGGVYIALHDDARIERRAQPRDVQRVAVTHGLLARAGRQIDREDDAVLIGIDASQHDRRLIGLRRETAGKLYQAGDIGVTAQLVDGRAAYLAVYRHRLADRWHEDDVPFHQRRIVGIVAANEQVIEIHAADELVAALEDDGAQGTDGFHTPGRIQR